MDMGENLIVFVSKFGFDFVEFWYFIDLCFKCFVIELFYYEVWVEVFFGF